MLDLQIHSIFILWIGMEFTLLTFVFKTFYELEVSIGEPVIEQNQKVSQYGRMLSMISTITTASEVTEDAIIPLTPQPLEVISE